MGFESARDPACLLADRQRRIGIPRPYSADLRERVVAAATRGLSASEAARLFSVSLSSAIRWNKRLRKTASAAAKPSGGDTRSKLNDHAVWLLDLIGEQPDLTRAEIRLRLAQRQVRCRWPCNDLAVLCQP